MIHSKTKQAIRFFTAGKKRSPGQLVVQISDSCNATCPQCELRINSKFQRSRIPLDELKKIIDKAAQNGVQALSFTGGEPFLFQDDLIEAIQHATKAGIPYVRTGTNGFFMCNHEENGWQAKMENLADKLADTDLYTLWFSLDSADNKTHQKMRGLDGVVKGMEKALPIFHERGIFPSANLGINRNTGGSRKIFNMSVCGVEDFYHSFHNSFSAFYKKVNEIGFTIVNACYPMSEQANTDNGLKNVYGAASNDDLVTFTRLEKAVLFQALFDVIGNFRDQLRIFSPKTSLYMLTQEYSRKRHDDSVKYGYPCRGGIDYFFIDAQSKQTWPCGFRSDENMGSYLDFNIKNVDTEADCRKCDWECFRDPSELIGPLMDIKQNPTKVFRNKLSDQQHYELWKEDLSYYNACNYFNGREKPDYFKMEGFRKKNNIEITHHILNRVREELYQQNPNLIGRKPSAAIYYSNNKQSQSQTIPNQYNYC